jgi:hypothetical protein
VISHIKAKDCEKTGVNDRALRHFSRPKKHYAMATGVKIVG